MRVAVAVTLSDEERTELERLARGRSVEARLVLRAKIVLAAAEGQENLQIAEELGTLRKTVGLWRKRFVEGRIAGIEKDAPRGGRPAEVKAKLAPEIVRITTRRSRRTPRTGARARSRNIWARVPKWCAACGRRRISSRIA